MTPIRPKLDYTKSNYFTHRIGDANDDSAVNTLDFTAMATNFGKTGQSWAQGDFNGDGKVNALDFNAIATNFGTADPRPATHEISGQVNFFSAGQRYDIAVEYSDKVALATIRVLWASQSRPKQEIPLDRLYASTVATTSALAGATPDLFLVNSNRWAGRGIGVGVSAGLRLGSGQIDLDLV